MLTLKRLAIFLATFFVVVIILFVTIDWRRIDNYLVNKVNRFSGKEETLDKSLVFVNLETLKTGSEGEDFRKVRQETILFLNSIANASINKTPPKGILLDFWFSNDTTELEGTKAALKRLKDLKIKVYASYNINERHENIDINKIQYDEIEALHTTEIYTEYLHRNTDSENGRYHTFYYPDNDVANYNSNIYLHSKMFEQNVLIEPLVAHVANDLGTSGSSGHNKMRNGSVVPYRSLAEIERKTYTFTVAGPGDSGSFQPPAGSNEPIDLAKNIIIVGDITNDLIDIGDGKKIPGPYIVGWALSDLLDNNNAVLLPTENLYLIIGIILFFSAFTVLLYALIFKYAKRLQTKPLLVAALAFAGSLLLLFALYKTILIFKAVIPIGQPIAAMLTAALLAWRFAHKFLVTGVAEGGQKYDVFISYSHSQSDWVFKNVYEPLAAYRKPNGDKLSIFFDKNSIGVGEAFTAKYMWAIVDTKCFLPIFSEDYYTKNHCKNEMDCAMKRWVEKLVTIHAIAFSFKAVPEAYNSINYIDINSNPEFIEDIKKQLAEKL